MGRRGTGGEAGRQYELQILAVLGIIMLAMAVPSYLGHRNEGDSVLVSLGWAFLSGITVPMALVVLVALLVFGTWAWGRLTSRQGDKGAE